MNPLSESRELKQPIVLIGGGGHCKACIDVIETTGKWDILGILDLPERMGEMVLGYPIVGTDDQVGRFVAEGARFLVCVGQIRTADARRRAYERVKAAGGRLATIVSPLAYVSPSAVIGEGTIVMHRAIVNASASVGDNVIINTMALVEHDATVGSHCHVSTAAVLNGGARIGVGSFVGSNAVIIQGATVPEDDFVPAGAVYRQRKE
jgi:sugar O-acyltransferase (sialic acid O-acetyltransferase NeuD family)